MADENFFGMAPEGGDIVAPDAGLPPPAEDGGFTLLGEAEAPADGAAYVGDVQEEGMGFAAAPVGEENDDDIMFAAAADTANPDVLQDDDGDFMGFAAAPGGDDDMNMDMNNMNNAPIVLGAPPAIEDTPIILGGAPPAVEDAEEEEEEELVKEEPSAMKKFNAEWQETLAARRQEEDDAKAAMVEAAKVAMDEFQAKRDMKRDAKMAKNREDEQAKLEDIEADLENDNSWQRVSKMVDLTQDGAEDGEDTKRMRDVFILLKNEQGLAAKVGA